MALSFILPLVLWSIACYGPWWKVAHQVNVAAESPRLQSVYSVEDRLTSGAWQEFCAAITLDNEEILAARNSNSPLASSALQNKKITRQLHPLAVANGWLTREQELEDDAIRKTWIGLADGKLKFTQQPLSAENLKIVKANAETLAKASPDWPTEALLKLLPQSSEEVSRPVYLVPPGVVAASFWKGITATTPEADAAEAERIGLSGFFMD